MAIATRTVNPLHFEDLEPHRFEDMVRQLIYDLRPWKSLEAVGRSGSDEGIDIRATETTTDYFATPVELEDQADEELPEAATSERIWLIQCKRERSLAPKKIATIVADNLKNSLPKPAVYMLVAACDFSKAARDAFRDNAVAQGVEEFYIWGKAELEDLLFQPKNDHLLFAYFGISLQVRKRTLKTQFRSNYLLKKKIYSLLGNEQDDHTPVLLRDANADAEYPRLGDVEMFLRNPGWRYFEYFGPLHMDAVTFRSCAYLCYADWEKKEFDTLNFDVSWVNYPELHGLSRDLYFSDALTPLCTQPLYSLWHEVTPEEKRGKVFVLDSVAYDRILLVDEVGDFNEAPHIVVQCPSNGKFFGGKPYLFLDSVGTRSNQGRLQGWT